MNKYIYLVKFTSKYRYIYHASMIESNDIPNLPGYVSIKEAADMLGVSDKRVYQYVRTGRLSAQRVGHILILPTEEINKFKPSPSGRVRTKAPSWRSYRSRGTLLVTNIHVQVRSDQQTKLVEKLKSIQKADRFTFPGTVARYLVKGDTALTTIQIVLVWKTTEMPDEATRKHDWEAFQDELNDMLDWKTAQYSMNEALIHT
jgi:excisionase family DNA binding protein